MTSMREHSRSEVRRWDNIHAPPKRTQEDPRRGIPSSRAGLEQAQDPLTGGWFFVVDKPDRKDNWIDTSGSAMFTFALERGIELGLLDRKEYSSVVTAGYRAITRNARVNSDGLVDILSSCDGVCVQASYSDYVGCKRTVNAKEAVGGFLWATTVVEKPSPANLKDPTDRLQEKVRNSGKGNMDEERETRQVHAGVQISFSRCAMKF